MFGKQRLFYITQFIAITLLMALFIVPFVMNYRVGPLSSFYIESTTMALALLLVISIVVMGYGYVKIPFLTWAILLFSVYLLLQAWLLQLPWQSQVHLTVAILWVVALLTFAMQGLLSNWRIEAVLTIIASALVLGTLLESFAMWVQFARVENVFAGLIMKAKNITNIYGQLGQRNHLGHYMTWGVIAASYLLAMRKVPIAIGIAVIVWLGISLGLVASRSITLYAILVMFLSVFAIFTQKQNRTAWVILLLAMVWVLLSQAFLSHVLDWFGWEFKGGLDRAIDGSAIDSSRQYEWKKAWLIFQSAPLFGHGWGSYSVQGFMIDGLPDFDNRGRTGVLYTHSHNLILQLLAETGLVGTLLVVVAMAYCFCKLIFQRSNPHYIFVAALALVTLCHSLLEYPLWYTYFLVPFVILLSFSNHLNLNDGLKESKRRLFCSWFVIALAGLALLELIRLGFAYQTMLGFSARKADTIAERAEKTMKLKRLAEHEYLISYYAKNLLMRHLNPAKTAQVEDWEVKIAEDTAGYRPFGSQAFKLALYKMHAGQVEDAKKWSEYTWHYYPKYIASYRRDIGKQAIFDGLQAPAYAACLRYQPLVPTLQCQTTITGE